MPKFVYDGLEYSSNGHVVKLTQAEYDALPNTKLADDIIYLIIDSNDDRLEAKNLPYDGSITGLGNTVQDAIDNLILAPDYANFYTIEMEHIATEPGYVYAGIRASADRRQTITVNGITVSNILAPTSTKSDAMTFSPLIPVAKNDVININHDVLSAGGTAYNTHRRFVPLRKVF
jgi:hypothetical protein